MGNLITLWSRRGDEVLLPQSLFPTVLLAAYVWFCSIQSHHITPSIAIAGLFYEETRTDLPTPYFLNPPRIIFWSGVRGSNFKDKGLMSIFRTVEVCSYFMMQCTRFVLSSFVTPFQPWTFNALPPLEVLNHNFVSLLRTHSRKIAKQRKIR